MGWRCMGWFVGIGRLWGLGIWGGMEVGRGARRAGVPKDGGDTGSLRGSAGRGYIEGDVGSRGMGLWGLGMLFWGSWVAQGVRGDTGGEGV